MTTCKITPWVMIIGVGVTSYGSGCKKTETDQLTEQQAMEVRLLLLGEFMLSETHEEGALLAFPEGDVQALEEWLDEKLGKPEKDATREAFVRAKLGRAQHLLSRAPSGKIRLIDLWGARLKYRFPARDPRQVFCLYSIGKNGRDEKGRGDDIDASQTYRNLARYFEDPGFDGDTYRKYRGSLEYIREPNGLTRIRHPGTKGNKKGPGIPRE